MKASVVVATYNRLHLLLDLVADLGRQTMAPSDFEVIVVDDGSAVPVAPRLAELSTAYSLVVRAQPNAGAGAARHNGILVAQSEIIVILDDDMSVAPDFLEQHVAAHERGATVVQGYIAPPSEALPLFERFHAEQLERFVRAVESGRERLRGIHICTGNLSFRRADYIAVGGFDPALARSEDRDLGVRMEKAGAHLMLSTRARSAHRSDHDSLDNWLRRSFHYGVYDLRIARKHPDAAIANPWRFIFLVSPVSRPLLLGAVAAPDAGVRLSRAAFAVARLVDRGPGRRAAIAGATLAYGLQYFSGLRREYGSVRDALAGLAEYAVGKHGIEEGAAPATAWGRFVGAVRADYLALARTRAKYNDDNMPLYHLPADVARKIGFQMMVAVRAMRLLRDSRMPLLARVASRVVRHAYGAEIHWDAELAPGVVLIHGNGLVVSRAARAGEGCILFHNVTLGIGADPETRELGAPHLGRNVHVGPGATLIGPITVGDGTKIMAGAVLTRSVPEGSLVRPADVEVHDRRTDGGSGKPVRHLRSAEAAN